MLSLGIVFGAVGIAGTASAATLSLDSAAGFPIQHTENSPCIISSVNCPNQPATFPYTDYVHGGITNIDVSAPTSNLMAYTVGQIADAIGGYTLGVGIDVSQTNANSPQTLDFFIMYVDEVHVVGGFATIDIFTGFASPGNVAVQNNNGSGFADWTLTGFTDLSIYDDADQVIFRAVVADLNDGPEQFFIYNTSNPPEVIPLPAAGWLLITVIGGVGLVARRRRSI